MYRLLGLEVASLEDVYWLEDSKAKQALQKDFAQWTVARQALPTSPERLASLKEELWSEVVKSSQHQDAWTWGITVVHSLLCTIYTLILWILINGVHYHSLNKCFIFSHSIKAILITQSAGKHCI